MHSPPLDHSLILTICCRLSNFLLSKSKASWMWSSRHPSIVIWLLSNTPPSHITHSFVSFFLCADVRHNYFLPWTSGTCSRSFIRGCMVWYDMIPCSIGTVLVVWCYWAWIDSDLDYGKHVELGSDPFMIHDCIVTSEIHSFFSTYIFWFLDMSCVISFIWPINPDKQHPSPIIIRQLIHHTN